LAAESGRAFDKNRIQALALAARAVHETYWASETCGTVVNEADIALAQSLWSPGAPYASLDDHTAPVLSAAFSPDGERIVTASSDASAKVWDVESGALLVSLDDHTAPVWSAAFSPDGERIVTASWDASAKVWDVDTTIPGMLAEAEEWLARLLSPEEFADIFEHVEPCSP
jgi:WD40 repeat protein